MAEDSAQSSSLKQFLASIATIKGDLSNITAPPFVLADKSTTEFPRYWAERGEFWITAAAERDPARRCLAVLKWFLASLRGQTYAGRDPNNGIKKPLNAFLGEVFIAECGDDSQGVTKLVSEQVSHHPPVTACYLWNDKLGVRAEGYTRQEITFTGSVNIQQIGYAVLTIDAFEETYLIPLPNVKVKGILTGSPYPELHGSYSIVSSSGFVAEVAFSGKSGVLGLGGQKNHVEAAVYRSQDDPKGRKRLFTATGIWSENFVIEDSEGKEIDSCNVAALPATPFRVAPLEEQDEWESRRAWAGVIAGVHAGDMKSVAERKNALENAQRELRKHPQASEEEWRPLFFRRERSNPAAEKLLSSIGKSCDAEKTSGVWRYDAGQASSLTRPWRGGLTPHG